MKKVVKPLHKSIGNPFWETSRFKRVHKNKKKYNRKKKSKELNRFGEEKWSEEDHTGCFSYPFCYMDPRGCREQTPDEELEEYGHRG